MGLGKQAKVLSKKQEQMVLHHLERTRYPTRNQLIFLLSIKSGLRAKEISQLTWAMVTDAEGQLIPEIHLQDHASKGKSGRMIPMNSQLMRLLTEHQAQTKPLHLAPHRRILLSERGSAMSAKVIVNWFRQLYAELGFQGCSSHSGRRTFVTRLANEITKAGGSLKDVQAMAGHQSLNTTQRYIEANHKARQLAIEQI